MYYIGSKKTLFNMNTYFTFNFYGLFQTFIIFFVPLGIYQANYVLLPNGKSVDLWTLSVTSFTCLYICVTSRIYTWTRWWTSITFVFYIIFSVWFYIAYVWFSEFVIDFSKVAGAITIMNQSYLFWLALTLILGGTFCSDLIFEYL